MSLAMTPTPPAAPTPWDRLARLSGGVAAAALAGLVLVQAWQVFARYVMNSSPSWTEPVTVLLLSTALSLAAAACVHEQRHFSFNLLAEAASPRARHAMAMGVQAVIAVIGGFIAVGAARLWIDGLDVLMAGAPLSQGVGFLPLAIGGALMVLFALHRAWRLRHDLPGKEA